MRVGGVCLPRKTTPERRGSLRAIAIPLPKIRVYQTALPPTLSRKHRAIRPISPRGCVLAIAPLPRYSIAIVPIHWTDVFNNRPFKRSFYHVHELLTL